MCLLIAYSYGGVLLCLEAIIRVGGNVKIYNVKRSYEGAEGVLHPPLSRQHWILANSSAEAIGLIFQYEIEYGRNPEAVRGKRITSIWASPVTFKKAQNLIASRKRRGKTKKFWKLNTARSGLEHFDADSLNRSCFSDKDTYYLPIELGYLLETKLSVLLGLD